MPDTIVSRKLDWFVKPFVVSLAVGCVILLITILWGLSREAYHELKELRGATKALADELYSVRQEYATEIAGLQAELEAAREELKVEKKHREVEGRATIKFPTTLPKVDIDALRRANEKRLLDRVEEEKRNRMAQREQLQLVPKK